MIRDVLVFMPVLRLEPETVQGIFAMEWDGPLSILFQRDNPSGDAHADHLHQYQRGREAFLNGQYEALLVIESDILPPKGTLKRLAGLECDIAYGAYLFRTTRVINVTERYRQPARNMGESLTVRGLYQAAVKMGVIDCSGSGMGCVLIRRRVLEETPFLKPKDPGFCDWDWTERAYRKGYTMRADMSVKCGHKKPDGEVIWPA